MGPDQTILHFGTSVMEILLIHPFETTTGINTVIEILIDFNKKISINGIAKRNFLGIQKNRKNLIKNIGKSSGRAARTLGI